MDRDNRWERVGKAYDAMVYGEGNKADNAVDAIKVPMPLTLQMSSLFLQLSMRTARCPQMTALSSSISVLTEQER